MLYKGTMLTQVFYTSIDAFDWSDHKPVVSLFRNKIYKSDPIKKSELKDKVKETFSTLLKESVPKAKLDKTDIIIENVRYGVETNSELIISNIGESPLEYRITKDPFNWLTLRPTLGVIMSGQVAKITISILVTNEEARVLHDDPNYLKASINVKTSGNQDFNANINGIFTKSCFGGTLELLNSVKEGFGALDVKVTSSELIKKCSEKLVVPKEIYKLTKWLSVNGIKTEKLFVLAGNEESKAQVREALELNKELGGEHDAYAVADTLLDLLESMPNIIPEEIMTSIVKEYESSGDKNRDICSFFLMKLPEDNAILVTYLLSFCKYLLEYSEYNNLSVEILVKVLSSCLVHYDREKLDLQYIQEEDNERRAKIAQIVVKMKLRYQGLFAILLTS